MPVVGLNDIFAVTFDGRIFGQQDLTTLYYKATESSGFDTDYLVFINAFHAKIEELAGLSESYAACLSESMDPIVVQYQKIYPTRYVRFRRTTINSAGEVAEAALPPNVNAVITLRTDAAGRTQRANKHIGAVPPSFTEDGQTTVAAMTALSQFAAQCVTPLAVIAGGDSFTMTPIIYHRADPTASPIITNFIVQETTRVIRRRTVGLGS